MAAGASLGRSEEELGRLLVQRQIITSEQLDEATRAREARRGEGAPVPSLGEILVQKGFIPSEDVLQALRSESGILASCRKCGHSFKILSYNPASSYSCRRCGGPLEKVESPETGSAAGSKEEIQVLSAALAGASPEDVTAAAQDPKNHFGKYILVKELARGGAGIVHKAWDSYLSRYIVLKFLKPSEPLTGDTPFVGLGIQDFLREAKLAARMRHPNIVSIHEVGRLEGTYYISMDFIGGSTFYEIIHGHGSKGTSTRFHKDPEKILQIVRDVALAVDHAHHEKPPIVHRDLKPQNVLIDAAGRAFVTDFGLALQVMLGRRDTEEGLVKGTPSYMAPEQAEARYEEIDPRTDIYSLGAILYEVLCGRPPFVGDDIREVVSRVREERPNSPTEVIRFARTVLPDSPNRPQPVPKELERICLKALERKKADRYQSAKEFAGEIEKYLKSKEVASLEARTRRKVLTQEKRIRWKIPLITAVLAVAAAAGVFLMLPSEPAEPAELLVARASRHLEAGEWPALGSVVAEMTRRMPGHPELKRFQKEIKEHAERLDQARRDWGAGLGRLGADPLERVLEDLRRIFRKRPELRGEFRDELKWALTALQPALAEEARELVGSGPGPGWLEDEAKQRAQSLKERIGILRALGGDEDFAFKIDAGVSGWEKKLDRVIAYRGTWYLQVNVAPFAEVVIRGSDGEVARDMTPLGIPGLEVAPEGYQVDLFWPSIKNPKVKVTREIRDLQNGMTIVIQGDMAKSEIRIKRE